MFETYQLKNGAQVVLVPLKDTQSFTTLVMYPVGSRYEPEKLSGVSHYIEHLMFKGTKKRKNTLVLTREIDRLGAEYNAFTGKEYTGYYIKADANYRSLSFDILADMLFNSVFDPKEMEREKGPIIEELKMYRDNPLINIDNIFERLLYGDTPLGRDIGGTYEHVAGYRRPEVLRYRHTHYVPSNMTIVVAGAVDQAIRDSIALFFGAKRSTRTPSRQFERFRLGSVAKSKRLVIEPKATDQAQLMLGFPAFPYDHEKNAALSVLNTILGGSMSSRLFIEVRERKGLAYTVKSGQEHFRDTGYSFVQAGLDPKNINQAMKIIAREIRRLTNKGVGKRELADAKTHIRGSLTLSLENTSFQANWYARQALFMRRMHTPEQKLAHIDQVSSADIKRVAKEVFVFNKMRLAIIGDVEAKTISF